MALNFPNDPTVGEQYTDPNGVVWKYDGAVWNVIFFEPVGVSGFSGFSGISGMSGFSGETGETGVSGFSGFSGIDGTIGASGFSGISGFSGFSGFSGIDGTSGASGFSGISGFSGMSGQAGESGFSGTSGFSGESDIAVSSEGSVLSSTVPSFNFTGDNVTTTNVGGAVTVLIGDPIPPENIAYGWGRNAGTLGDNTTTSRSSPVSVIGGFTDWSQVSAGGFHSLAIRQNGTAWALGTVGNPPTGALGDNTTVNRSSPVSVVGGFTDWCQISAGRLHSLAVRQNGTAWAWGSNSCGQLGTRTDCTTSRSSPVSVVGGFTNWCQISAGREHSLGVRTSGTAWAWGRNSAGRLGDNTTVNKSSPVSVIGGFTDWCQISANDDHSLGVRQNGTAWAWGSGSNGILGDNCTTQRLSPVSVVGGFTDWCQVGAGNNHSLGLRQNGTAWSWGVNDKGQLGDSTGCAISRSSPVSVVGGFTDWCQLSGGSRFSLAVRTNGTAWAWGCNGRGRLGDNTTVDKSSPVSVVGGFTDWCQISASGNEDFSLAIRSS